jgi:hypothetical protein
LLQAHCKALEKGLCHCSQRATLELSYVAEMDQRASSPSSASGLLLTSSEPDSPATNVLYQSLPVEQVTTLVLVLEEVGLLSPSTSEDKIVQIPPPCACSVDCPMSGLCCWTTRKAEHFEGVRASRRLF